MVKILNDFCQKAQILLSSDHSILLEFRQLVVNIIVKELQMVFWTSTVSKSYENMAKLDRKFRVKT